MQTHTAFDIDTDAARSDNGGRNDDGFSFAQVIVTMIIIGVLTVAVGFTVFNFIGQARNTVLASNVRTAAEAVQTAISLNPQLRTNITAGAPSPDLIAELTALTPLVWDTTWDMRADAVDAAAQPNVIHIQMIEQGAARQASASATPRVRWLVGTGDAVRIQARNTDGAWACALIVLRPDWNNDKAGANSDVNNARALTAEGQLRGVWYDTGAVIPPAGTTAAELAVQHGLQHCSPVGDHNVPGSHGNASGCPSTFVPTPSTRTALYGNCAAGDGGPAADALPVSTSAWNFPASGTGTGVARTFERSVNFDG